MWHDPCFQIERALAVQLCRGFVDQFADIDMYRAQRPASTAERTNFSLRPFMLSLASLLIFYRWYIISRQCSSGNFYQSLGYFPSQLRGLFVTKHGKPKHFREPPSQSSDVERLFPAVVHTRRRRVLNVGTLTMVNMDAVPHGEPGYLTSRHR